MKSRTKYEISDSAIEVIFSKAELGTVTKIESLGSGEYNAAYVVEADGHDYVLKVAPHPNTAVLTYENDMMRSEIFWYKQMEEHTSIGIPKIYFSDFSRSVIESDYFIMDKINGKQMNEAKLTADEYENACRQKAHSAAELHKVKNDKFGYIQNGLYDTWYDAYKSFITALLDDCKRKGKRSRRGEKILLLADKYKNVLEKAECVLVNFDIWDANILCRKENDELKYFWIDPERSFWGDRVFEFINFEPAKPYTKKLDSLKYYNEVSDCKLTCSDDEQIRFAFALALIALIQEAEKYYRYSLRDFGWWRNVGGSKMFYKNAFKILNK